MPWPAAGAITGVAVMVVTDGLSAALGTTDPRSWAPADWVADLVPHLAYGIGAILTLDALEG